METMIDRNMKVPIVDVEVQVDPLYDLFDNFMFLIRSPDCLRTLVLSVLSYLTLLNFVFLTNKVQDVISVGIGIEFYTVLCYLTLSIVVVIYSIITIWPLNLLTWESSKNGNDSILTGFLNRLIILMCIFLVIGFLTNPFRMTWGIIPIILFYSISIILYDGLAEIKHAKREVRLLEQ